MAMTSGFEDHSI